MVNVRNNGNVTEFCNIGAVHMCCVNLWRDE